MFADLSERNRGNNAITLANEVEYGRQDVDYEQIAKGRKSQRVHGERFALPEEKSEKNRITLGMSDSERANILKEKSITAPVYTGQADTIIIENKKSLESQQIGLVKSAIVTIGKEFGVIGQQINIKDVGVVITMSKSNLKESVSKDVTPIQMAKLLPVLKESVENAIGIEAHANRYYFDTDTVFFENLLGGYVDGEYFVPVRFGLKHSSTGKATLYVVVDQNKISADNLMKIKNDQGRQDASPDLTESNNLHRLVTYSIADIVPFVNSKDVLRYLSDDMLNEKQKTAKWAEIANTIKRTNDKNDKKYLEFIKNGNLNEAAKMVNEAAKKAGYTTDAYHGTNQGNFTVFDWSKTQRADGGFFGRGHYFTKSENVAKMYGARIIKGKLKLGKTFVWNEMVNSYQGKKPPELLSRNVVSRINLAKIFPNIFSNQKMSYMEYDTKNGEYIEKTIKWGELEGIVNDLADGLALREYADGTYKWHTEGRFWEVPVGESFPSENDAEKGKFFAAINALPEKYDGLLRNMSFDDQTTYTQQHGTEITEALKKSGYESAMDTNEGGEIVVFDSSQVKSADPVTYDDNGNVIPLSERFNADNNDIRYALPEEGKKKKKYHMSHGQLRADVANKTRKKAYSKADARATPEGFTGADLLTKKAQNELADSPKPKVHTERLTVYSI
jgi:hypothetical protein